MNIYVRMENKGASKFVKLSNTRIIEGLKDTGWVVQRDKANNIVQYSDTDVYRYITTADHSRVAGNPLDIFNS